MTVTTGGRGCRSASSCSSSALEVDVELLEQLAVLVLGGNDLDVRSRVPRQGPAKVSSSSDCVAVAISPRWNRTVHQRRRIDVDLLGEVGQRGALTQTDRSRPLPRGDAHTADDRCFQLFVLVTLRQTVLASLRTCRRRRPKAPAAPPRPRPPPRDGPLLDHCSGSCCRRCHHRNGYHPGGRHRCLHPDDADPRNPASGHRCRLGPDVGGSLHADPVDHCLRHGVRCY